MKLPGTYVDGFLLPIPKDKIEAYRGLAQAASTIWREHGALQYTECLADDLGTDFCRSFLSAAGANEDETVIFAWAVFADRGARDSANANIMADERIKSLGARSDAIFDCKRMAFGGFNALVAG